jgi:urease accessory protein
MRSWLVLQLADSAFPTGGFAHSAGLEAARQAGEVAGRAALRRFAEEALWQAGQGGLVLASAAHTDALPLGELDARADAFLVNHVANRASRAQGRAFLDTCARVFPSLGSLRDEARRGAAPCLHHAPLFGAALRRLGVALDEAQRLYLHGALRTVLSAAVRLGEIGTNDAQALQAQLAPALDAVLAQCAGLGPDALAQTAPVLDLLAATHDRLYSRLFLS